MASRIFAAAIILSTVGLARADNALNQAHLVWDDRPVETSIRQVWLPTEWDFDLDFSAHTLSVNYWLFRDPGGAVAYSVTPFSVTLTPQTVAGYWEADFAGGHVDAIEPGYVPGTAGVGWGVFFFPAPKPVVDAELIAGLTRAREWELRSMAVQVPEPASVAIMGLAAALAAARNRWRRSS